MVTINVPANSSSGEVKVFNLFGQLLVAKNITNSPVLHVDLSSYPNGIYLIRLTDYTGKFVVKKMIKE